MLLKRLAGRRIVFVGGKGGVGKTTTAAALGLILARRGEKVLLVSTDPAHSLGDLFDVRIGDREKQIVPGLTAMEIDPDRQVEAYLGRVGDAMRSFVGPERFPEMERQLRLTRQSPGAVEAALLDRVTALMTEAGRGYDRIVYDTAPTGHTLRLLTLPEIMAAWTDGLLESRDRSDALGRALDRLNRRGKPESGDELSLIDQVDDGPDDPRNRRIRDILMERRRTFSRARRLLLDAEASAFVLVLIPEKLPIQESRKTLDFLKEHRIPVAGVVVNRVLPVDAGGDFLRKRREQEAHYLEEIDRTFGDLLQIRVPFLPQDVNGVEGLESVLPHLIGSAEP